MRELGRFDVGFAACDPDGGSLLGPSGVLAFFGRWVKTAESNSPPSEGGRRVWTEFLAEGLSRPARVPRDAEMAEAVAEPSVAVAEEWVAVVEPEVPG